MPTGQHRRSIETRLSDICAERIRAASAAAALALVLTACGGGGGHATPTLPGTPAQPTAGGPSGPTSDQRAPASISLRIPPPKKTPSSRGGKYVSPSSAGIGINIYAAAAGSIPSAVTPQYAADLTATGPGAPCVAQPDGSKLCTFHVSAPPGNDILAIYLYDGPPSGGSFAGKNLLSAAQSAATIVANKSNTVSAVLEGVVSTVAIFSSNKFTFNGDNGYYETPLAVSAYDAGGNLIIPVSGENYWQSITVALTSNTSHVRLANGVNTSSSITIAGPDAPTALASLTLQWDGAEMTAPTTISASIDGADTPAVVGNLSLPAPHASANIQFSIASNLQTVAVVEDLTGPANHLTLPTSGYFDAVIPHAATQTVTDYYGAAASMQYSVDPLGNADLSGHVGYVAFAGTQLAMAYETATLGPLVCTTDSLGVSFCNSVARPFVEIDTQDPAGTVFADFSALNATFTDLCDVHGLAADFTGNIAVLGTPGCAANEPVKGQSARRLAASATSQRHASSPRRSAAAGSSRSSAAVRRTRNAGPNPYVLEFIPQPNIGAGSAAPLATISVAADAIGLTSDAAGNIYLGHANGSVDKYLNAGISASTTGPNSTIWQASEFSGSAVAVAANASGSVAELLYNGTSTYWVSVAAPGATTSTIRFEIASAAIDGNVVGMTYDVAGNLWIASPTTLYAYTPSGGIALIATAPWGVWGIGAPMTPALSTFTAPTLTGPIPSGGG